MSKTKKQVRESFRNSVFARDGYCCRVCGKTGELDAHHITDRNEMPHGGYVAKNGISLCSVCHNRAEQYHVYGGKHWFPAYHPNDLYEIIGSSKEEAIQASENSARIIDKSHIRKKF